MSTAARSWWMPRALAGAVLAALALALAALNWPDGREPSGPAARPAPAVRQAAAPAQPAAAAAAASGRVELERFEQRRMPAGAAPVRDAFAAAPESEPVVPARPARPASARVEEPAAPPVPFRFLGRYDDGGTAAVVLLMGERVYIASPGHVIDDTWRLDRLGRRQVELTYLPLQLRQTMSTGE